MNNKSAISILSLEEGLTRHVAIPVSLNLAYWIVDTEQEIQDKWYEAATLWIGYQDADEKDNLKKLTFVEANVYTCPTAEEIEAALEDDLMSILPGNLVSYSEAIISFAAKAQKALDDYRSKLSPLPKP